MDNLKQENKHSFRNKYFVLGCLTIVLLGIAFFRIKFPAFKAELSDTLFIAVLLVTLINVFREKKKSGF